MFNIKREIRQFLNSKGYWHRSQIKINEAVIKKVIKDNIEFTKDFVDIEKEKLTVPDYLTLLIAEEVPIMFVNGK